MLCNIVTNLLGQVLEQQPLIENGKIVSRDARIRAEAMQLLDLPVECQKGEIGFLEIEISNDGNWKCVHAKIEIRDLFLLIVPKEEESDESRAQRSREQIVANLVNDTNNRIASLFESELRSMWLPWWSRSLLLGRLLSKITVTCQFAKNVCRSTA